MSAKEQLQRSIYHLLKHNKHGAYETQDARKKILMQAARELTSNIFKLKHISGIKQKHIIYLNKIWREQGLSVATIKNRNAHLRWICEILGKINLVPSNDALGIDKRQASGNHHNKAVELNKIDLSRITNRYILVQIHLQRYLGLRREECIKFKPHLADKGTHIVLQPSWCKGGRGREVPITTQEARYWLEEAKKLISNPNQSLIAENKNYIQHRHLYDNQTRRAGIKHPHGLRHAYAQDHYKTLTGWECPKQGGLTYKKLTTEQKIIDEKVRLLISQHLGHNRSSILSVYLGK